MANNSKTNAIRLLERSGIKFDVIPYMVDENDLAATHVAEQLNENISQVFKTLVLHGDHVGYFVCVIPGDKEVDLKKAAHAIGAKKVEMIAMKDLLPGTGYIRGGCSPIGMKKSFPTFFDITAKDFDYIYVSAGVRGLQIRVNPSDLIGFVSATTVDLIKTNQPHS